MRLPVAFPALDRVRRHMGAPLSRWSLTSPESKQPEVVEISVPPDGIERIQAVRGDGPLQIDGQQILLYIKDTGLDRHTLLHDPENSRRYHIANCSTLEQMRRENRHRRYVATNKSSGLFRVDARDHDSGIVEENLEATLYVCKNCLGILGFMEEREDWPEFSIDAFFRDHETFFSFSPQYTDVTAPPSDYPRNWHRISRLAKEKKNYTCEECGVYCGESKKTKQLLHCHHIDGVKRNNQPDNLRVLCAECHCEQPGHGRHPAGHNVSASLAHLRTQQGIERR